MELQGYGVIEARPTYTHVGYTSAGVEGYLRNVPGHVHGSPLPGSTILLVALGFAVATAAHWRRSAPARRGLWVMLTVLFLSAGAVALGVMRVGSIETIRTELSMETELTLANFEGLLRLGDAWASEHGRPPTRSEWPSVAGELGARDGWFAPLAYEVLPAPGRDGRAYRLTSRVDGRHGETTWPFDLTSTMLGRDGLFGTLDDSPELQDLARQIGLDPATGDVPRWRQR